MIRRIFANSGSYSSEAGVDNCSIVLNETKDLEAVVRSTLNRYWKYLITSGLTLEELPAYRLERNDKGYSIVKIVFPGDKIIQWHLNDQFDSHVEIRDRFSLIKLHLHPHEVLSVLKEYAY